MRSLTTNCKISWDWNSVIITLPDDKKLWIYQDNAEILEADLVHHYSDDICPDDVSLQDVFDALISVRGEEDD